MRVAVNVATIRHGYTRILRVWSHSNRTYVCVGSTVVGLTHELCILRRMGYSTPLTAWKVLEGKRCALSTHLVSSREPVLVDISLQVPVLYVLQSWRPSQSLHFVAQVAEISVRIALKLNKGNYYLLSNTKRGWAYSAFTMTYRANPGLSWASFLRRDTRYFTDRSTWLRSWRSSCVYR